MITSPSVFTLIRILNQKSQHQNTKRPPKRKKAPQSDSESDYDVFAIDQPIQPSTSKSRIIIARKTVETPFTVPSVETVASKMVNRVVLPVETSVIAPAVELATKRRGKQTLIS